MFAKRQGGRKCWYFSRKLWLDCVTWYYQQFGLDTGHGFPAVTPGLHNLQSILPGREQNKKDGKQNYSIWKFSSRDISTCIELLGLMSSTLALIAIILCFARRTKSVAFLETERRTEHSCKIFLLEPPPPPPLTAVCRTVNNLQVTSGLSWRSEAERGRRYMQ